MTVNLFNFRTGKSERRQIPANDEEALDYIPQITAYQNLFKVERLKGISVIDVINLTLLVSSHDNE